MTAATSSQAQGEIHGEFGAIPGPGSPPSVGVDPRRTILYGVAVVLGLGILGWYAMSGSEPDIAPPTKAPNAATATAKSVPGGSQASLRYTQEITDLNDERAKAAEASGVLASAPIPIYTNPQPAAVTTDATPTHPSAQTPIVERSQNRGGWDGVGDEAQSARSAPQQVADKEAATRYKRILDYLAHLQQRSTAYTQPASAVYGDVDALAGVTPAGTESHTVPLSHPTTAVTEVYRDPSSILPAELRAGRIVPAVNLLAVNSDYQAPVVLELVSGSVRGWRAFGEFQRMEDRLVLSIRSVVDPTTGATHAIRGVAVDLEQTAPFVASDVDRRTISRWLALGAAGIASAGGTIANAILAQPPVGEYVITDAGTTVVTTAERDWSDYAMVGAASGLGNIGSALATVATDYFNRPPTVTLDPNQRRLIGILIQP